VCTFDVGQCNHRRTLFESRLAYRSAITLISCSMDCSLRVTRNISLVEPQTETLKITRTSP